MIRVGKKAGQELQLLHEMRKGHSSKWLLCPFLPCNCAFAGSSLKRFQLILVHIDVNVLDFLLCFDVAAERNGFV